MINALLHMPSYSVQLLHPYLSCSPLSLILIFPILPHTHTHTHHPSQHKYDEVIADCTEALKLDPLYAKAFHRRGQAHEHLGHVHDALYDYTAVCMLKKFADMDSMQTVERMLRTLGESQALVGK